LTFAALKMPLSNRQGLLPLHTGPSQLFAQFATPIPAQVYRSAWPWIGQRAVVFSRGVILVYLTVLFPLLVYSKLAESAAANQTRWNVLFDFWIMLTFSNGFGTSKALSAILLAF
jgi:hypothetical protein